VSQRDRRRAPRCPCRKWLNHVDSNTWLHLGNCGRLSREACDILYASWHLTQRRDLLEWDAWLVRLARGVMHVMIAWSLFCPLYLCISWPVMGTGARPAFRR